MATVNRCLAEIQAVRDVACGAEAAYVARSRVARLGLSVARLVSDLMGRKPPERLGRLPDSTDADGLIPEAIKLCNAVQDISEFIKQPSEPLDERWATMWDALEEHLDSLETVVLGIGCESVGSGASVPWSGRGKDRVAQKVD